MRKRDDRLENYVLALGIRGKKRWHAKWMFNYKGKDPGEVPEIDAIGKKVCALLDPLANAFPCAAEPCVIKQAEALYRFAQEAAKEKLIKAADDFQESGRPDLALGEPAGLPAYHEFLDKACRCLGNEPISMKTIVPYWKQDFQRRRSVLFRQAMTRCWSAIWALTACRMSGF